MGYGEVCLGLMIKNNCTDKNGDFAGMSKEAVMLLEMLLGRRHCGPAEKRMRRWALLHTSTDSW